MVDLVRRFELRLAQDRRLAAAMTRLPAKAWTIEWPMAELEARAASNAAVRRALWHVLRGAPGPSRPPFRAAAMQGGDAAPPKPLP